jgi:putative transposase
MYPYDRIRYPKELEEYNKKLSELQDLIHQQGLSIQVAPGGRCMISDNGYLIRKGILTPDQLPDPELLKRYRTEYKRNAGDNESDDVSNRVEPDSFEYGEVIDTTPVPSPEEIRIDPYPVDFYDLTPPESEKLSSIREAQLYARFCTEVLDRLSRTKVRTVEWQRITEDYNYKRMVPELFKLKGKRKERALRSWVDIYIESKYDMFALIHQNKHANRGRKVTYFEQKFLLNKLLNPNKVKIGSAITHLKNVVNLQLCESPSDERTLRRWCEEWRDNHPAEWAQAREGSKYVSERIIKSIIRDDSLLKVGDVWVADGHVLSFDIMNPATGKAQRMTMIMVMDWASRYPVGASLAFTEDSQHILAAFRNGFLNAAILAKNSPGSGIVRDSDLDNEGSESRESQVRDFDKVQTQALESKSIFPYYHPDYPLAVLPKYVYLDNGRAFKSKLFNERWEEHDLETELGGIFPQLNIGVSFAESYNAKAKVIERFFKTFQEQFERFISSFRGSSIPDKPANLMRNEKWAKKLFEQKPPTIEETMQMIAFYVRHFYGNTPHAALKRRTPYKVFSNGVIEQYRLIEAGKLSFLMLAMERKSIRSEGIRLNHMLYWHEKLVDNIGKPCLIRYDYNDIRWILVYTKENKFICQAELRRAQHPFIKLDMDNPIAYKDLDQETKHIKKLRRTTEQNTKTLVKNNQEAVDRQIASLQQISSRQITSDQTNEIPGKLFENPPLISPPSKSSRQVIEELQQVVMDDIPERGESDTSIESTEVDENKAQTTNNNSDKTDKPDKLDTDATDPKSADKENNEPQDDNLTPEGSLTETHTFEEMLKIIGLK